MKNQAKVNEILNWAAEQKVSAPKDESGMVLSINDAEILAYEYAGGLLAAKGIK